LLFLVSVVLALHQTVIYFRYFYWEHAQKIEVNAYSGWPSWELSEKDSLYIYGQRELEDFYGDWEVAIEAYPDDPVIYWRYSASGRLLPPGFRETVDRIAPENGFFDYLEANALARELLYNIDSARAMQFIELLEMTIQKPEFHDYSAEYRRGIFTRVPEHEDWVTQSATGISILYYRGNGTSNRSVHLALHRLARQAAEEGNREEFLKIFQLGESLTKRFMSPFRGHFWSNMALKQLLKDAKFYQEGAALLGMDEMLEALKRREEILEPHFGRAQFFDESLQHPLDDLATRNLWQFRMGKYLEGDYGLEDYRPMARTLDSFVAWQKSLQIFWLGLGVLLVMGIYCVCQPAALKARARTLMEEVSLLKVILLSSILPLAVFLGIHFLKISWNSEPDPG